MYEMPIRSFTADPSSGVGEGLQGTFAGAAAKVGTAPVKYLLQPCCWEGRVPGKVQGQNPMLVLQCMLRRHVVHP